MATTPKAKPYKLKPTEGIMTRDDVAMWEYTLIAACRQVTSWRSFLPGQERQNWVATDDDINNGLEVIDDNGINEEETNQLRRDFADFLTCVATHSPTGFMDTVMRESTSFKNIVEQIKITYGLQSKGEKFLNCLDIKFEFNEKFTYEMGYMTLKDFFMSSLLPAGSTFKNRALNVAETLSPLAENFIIKEFLSKVHPKLPEHVKNSKGYLFTEDKPTLACNRTKIIGLIDTMLQEIENNENNPGTFAMGQVKSGRGNFRSGRFSAPRGSYNRSSRPPIRGFRPPFNNRFQSTQASKQCSYCVEARRFDSSRGHDTMQCPFSNSYYNRDAPSRPNFKVFLVQDHHVHQPYVNAPYNPQYALENADHYDEHDSVHPSEADIYESEQYFGSESSVYDQMDNTQPL